MINSKPVKERGNLDLIELVFQLHGRSLQFPSKEMHDAYVEARTELEKRASQFPSQGYWQKRCEAAERFIDDAWDGSLWDNDSKCSYEIWKQLKDNQL